MAPGLRDHALIMTVLTTSDLGQASRRRLIGTLRRLLVNTSLFAASLLVAGLLAEVAVRVVAPQQLILKRPDIWRPDSVLGWTHQPWVRTTVNTGERTVTLVTDQDGYRVGTLGRREGNRTVFLLGDSFMEALQVEYERSFAGLLEDRVPQQLGTPIGVRNAGVGGWDPDQYLIRARDVLNHQAFDLVVVALYVENDAIDYWRTRVPARVPTEVHHLRLPKRLSVSELIDAVLYPINDMLEVRSQLFVFVKNRLQVVRMRLGLTAASFPWIYRRSEAASKRWENTAAICAEIASVARGKAIPVIFVLIPAPYQVDANVFQEYVRGFGLDTAQIDLAQPSRLLGEALRAKGLDVVDASPVFRAAQASGRILYGKVDNHLSPDGHEVLSGLMQPRIVHALAGRGHRRKGWPDFL